MKQSRLFARSVTTFSDPAIARARRLLSRSQSFFRSWPVETIRTQDAFGTPSNSKVWVMQEFKNSSENHLGMPLPRGRVRFYRRDDDGQLEFTGENEIDHTPKDELIRIYTGNACDLTGERHRVDYRLNSQARWVDESFEIKVRNHKTIPVEVRIVEHLYRWTNWDISKSSGPFKKVDAQTAAFTVKVPPGGEKVLTYQVHYFWWDYRLCGEKQGSGES
jgi:hypothetical protein